MEHLIENSEALYEEKICGCVYSDKTEAIDALLENAASDLFGLLKSDGTGAAGPITLRDRYQDIMEAMDRLEIAFNHPINLINVYPAQKPVKKK